jgi:Bacterial pullanase-associated domain
MSFDVIIHYDNAFGFANPHLWVWYAGSSQSDEFPPTGNDGFGPVFAVTVRRQEFRLHTGR